METTRPGIGDSTSLEVSAACFSGSLSCSSAERGVRTSTLALAARWRIVKPSAAGATWTVKALPSSTPRNTGLPGRQSMSPGQGAALVEQFDRQASPSPPDLTRRLAWPTATTHSVRGTAPDRPVWRAARAA
jgi:hypothetical protein